VAILPQFIDNRLSLRIALFVTCLADTLHPEVGRASVTVLERLGLEVSFPLEQTCCGQLHHNAGYLTEARSLGERFATVFAGYDAIVSPSASCVGHVRELLRELPGGADQVASRTWELSQFLVEQLGVVDVGARFQGRLTYHPTCHSLRVLKVGDAPLRLLQAVEGLELVPLADPEECCGFGGTFAIRNPDVSSAMLADKLGDIEQSGAAAVCACDASCLMQIRGGLERTGSAVRALHLAEVLAAR
jgi:L-lactate dehydrogenase complex protein LldE